MVAAALIILGRYGADTEYALREGIAEFALRGRISACVQEE